MHLGKYTGFLAVARSVPILFLIGCASVRQGVRVGVCVIPPPHVNAKGELVVDGAECVDAAGNDEKVPRPLTLMPRWVCHDPDDYFKVLESRK